MKIASLKLSWTDLPNPCSYPDRNEFQFTSGTKVAIRFNGELIGTFSEENGTVIEVHQSPPEPTPSSAQV